MEIWEKDQKENSHEKVSQSLILLRTHIHIHSSRNIPRTHGHQVFIVLYCSYQETSAKLNDLISKKWPAFCDYVIVLEDVHIYIHFVFYEVQKHLVTHVSMLYKNIQFRAATRPRYTLGWGQNKTALRQTIGWTNLIPTTTPVHLSSKMAHCHCFCFSAMSYYYLQYLSVYSIMDCGCI